MICLLLIVQPYLELGVISGLVWIKHQMMVGLNPWHTPWTRLFDTLPWMLSLLVFMSPIFSMWFPPLKLTYLFCLFKYLIRFKVWSTKSAWVQTIRKNVTLLPILSPNITMVGVPMLLKSLYVKTVMEKFFFGLKHSKACYFSEMDQVKKQE